MLFQVFLYSSSESWQKKGYHPPVIHFIMFLFSLVFSSFMNFLKWTWHLSALRYRYAFPHLCSNFYKIFNYCSCFYIQNYYRNDWVLSKYKISSYQLEALERILCPLAFKVLHVRPLALRSDSSFSQPQIFIYHKCWIFCFYSYSTLTIRF